MQHRLSWFSCWWGCMADHGLWLVYSIVSLASRPVSLHVAKSHDSHSALIPRHLRPGPGCSHCCQRTHERRPKVAALAGAEPDPDECMRSLCSTVTTRHRYESHYNSYYSFCIAYVGLCNNTVLRRAQTSPAIRWFGGHSIGTYTRCTETVDKRGMKKWNEKNWKCRFVLPVVTKPNKAIVTRRIYLCTYVYTQILCRGFRWRLPYCLQQLGSAFGYCKLNVYIYYIHLFGYLNDVILAKQAAWVRQDRPSLVAGSICAHIVCTVHICIACCRKIVCLSHIFWYWTK